MKALDRALTPSSADRVRFLCERRRKTDKAELLKIGDYFGWLPTSQVSFFRYGRQWVVEMPLWMALANELVWLDSLLPRLVGGTKKRVTLAFIKRETKVREDDAW